MAERKVLNKYYPPDFDPAKIPRLKLPKDRQYVVRLMAPFNMRCRTCGEYIYKGKKFNARKETVLNESYLGLPIFRFYIKCPRCLAEITFKTDPQNTDYAVEHGATRNFQAEKLLEEEEKRMQKEREEEELNNPMKVLENRIKESKLEMEILENLQELKELNQRQANVDFEAMLKQYKELEEEQRRKEQEEDEQEMKAMLEQAQNRRLLVDSDSDEEAAKARPNATGQAKPTDILQETDPENTDYTMEHGATRNFQAEKLLEEEEKRMQKEREEEELNNPMKVLENRTKDSKLEMEVLENLQELKELNQRQANVDFEAMLKQYKELEEEQRRKEQEEDEQEMKAMLEQAQNRRLLVDSDSDEEAAKARPNATGQAKPTDILQEDPQPQSKKPRTESWERSVGKLSTRAQLAGLVAPRKQKPDPALENRMETPRSTASTAAAAAAAATSSLGLLGAYSDSEGSASD